MAAKTVIRKTKTATRSRMATKPAVANEPMEKMPTVCRSCHALPAGSIELVSMLLVVVFSLSAVLITSSYALHLQNDRTTSQS